METRRDHCADLVAASIIIGVSILCGPTMLAVAGALGVSIASPVVNNGVRHVRRRVLHGPGALNHDLQVALKRAFNKSIVDLEKGWWETRTGNHLKRTDPGAMERIRPLFKDLRSEAGQVLLKWKPSQLTDAQVTQLAEADAARGHAALSRLVEEYFRSEMAASEEYREELFRYVGASLGDMLALRIGEELKQDDKAWRAFQRVVEEELRASVGRVEAGVLVVQASQDEVKAAVAAMRAELQAWTERMDRLPEGREPTGDTALERLLVDLQDRLLDAIAKIRDEVNKQGVQTRTEMHAGFDRLEGRLQHELDRRAELDRERRARDREWRVGDMPGDAADHFRDRVEEMRWLRERLVDVRLRFLLVAGLSGMGKTSLVAKLVKELEGDHVLRTDSETLEVRSVVWIPCRASQPPSLDGLIGQFERTLPSDVAKQLSDGWKARSSVEGKLEFLLHGALGNWPCIIVLDNLEDLLDEENYIRAEYSDLRLLIEKCLRLDHAARIVATSTRSLVLPDGLYASVGERFRELPRFEGLPEDDAVALLREIDYDGKLKIQEAAENELREVVGIFDCIPRTITSVRSATRQYRTFDRLFMDKAALARLAANPAEVRYRSLTADERRVVEALAVYDRAMPAAAMLYLLPELEVDGILDGLERDLIVAYDEDTYRLHPSDQKYAYAQIPGGDGEHSRVGLHRTAARYYEALRRPEGEWRTITALDPQIQQFNQLVLAQEYDRACEVLDEIDFGYLQLWGHSLQVIELRSQLEGRLIDPALEMLNLNSLGLALQTLGRVSESIPHLERSLDLAHRARNKRATVAVLVSLENAYTALLNPRKAIEYHEQALEIADEIGDSRLRDIVSLRMGSFGGAVEKSAVTIEQQEQALARARESGDRIMELSALLELGQTCLSSGEPVQGIGYYEQGLSVAREIEHRVMEALALLMLGFAHEDAGENRLATAFHEAALEIATQTDGRYVECAASWSLADIYGEVGDDVRAAEYGERAQRLRAELGIEAVGHPGLGASSGHTG